MDEIKIRQVIKPEQIRFASVLALIGKVKPITVRTARHENGEPKKNKFGEKLFILLDGHRRLEACEKLGMLSIPAYILNGV